MTWMDWLSVAANIAQAATGVVAVWLWVKYVWRAHERRLEIEEYLRRQKQDDTGVERVFPLGRRTIMHLMGALGMTESQVMEAAFASSKIKRTLGTDPKTGRADTIFFELF